MKTLRRNLMKMIALGAVIVMGGVSATQASQNDAKLAPILIPPARQQLIGLKFATVTQQDLVDSISTTGTVETNEQSATYVQTRFSGWIRRVLADQTWQHVKQGDPIFTIYSPDLVSAENEYLLSVRQSKALAKSSVDGVADGAASMVSASLDRLKQFGVPPSEIRRLQREGKARDEIAIAAPASGYIVDRQAFPNMYAESSMRLFTIANLSTVWVYAAVFQNQIAQIKTGDAVTISIDTYPGREFAGKVDFIWSALDPMTRTAKVRINLPNTEAEFKVGMFVNVNIKQRLGRGLLIPDSSVLQTGLHNIAFVDRGDGYLEPRELELGPHMSGGFVVRKGLSEGDRIVSSANFLIDSESQLQAAVGAYVPPPPGASAAGQAAAQTATIAMKTDPSPPQKGKNTVTLELRDSFGAPIDGANVSVVFYMPAMPAMGMAAMRRVATATARANGTYIAGINLDSGGGWQVSVSASKAGQQVATLQTNVSATGGM
jgi:Cu(I)/Ag(I) efflux system membrane fusion protein/cobalt-zinc-cadmium efflux system membrane fusion protein